MTAPLNDALPLQRIVTEEDVGKRLDLFAAELAELTRSAAARLIEDGMVTLNAKPAAKNTKLRLGDQVELLLPEPEPCEAIPQNIPLEIVFEDDDIIVVNKPCGMVVHPAAGNPDGTLVNALLWHCRERLSGIGGVLRPGIVHRIDKDTEGLLVVAKNDASHLFLADQLKTHQISRIYTAIALGGMPKDCGTVDAPIGRHPTDRKKMAVIRNTDIKSRNAVTHWKRLSQGSADGTAFSLLQCELETGRTHQIRVHMASLGHPLLGDPLYSGDHTRFQSQHSTLLQGQCLHAGKLRLIHPKSRCEMQFSCRPSREFQTVCRLIFGEEAESLF